MSENKFDLIAIFKELLKRYKFILLFTLITVIAGLIFSLVQKDKYTSKSVFIVKSPMVMDRNHIFKRDNYQQTDFFASENDIDHIETIGKSSTLMDYIAAEYSTLKGGNTKSSIIKKFQSKVKFKRGSTRSFEIAVTDEDPEIAAKLATAATDKIEAMYKDYFLQSQRSMTSIMQERIKNIDTQLAVVEDSILSIRNAYGVFDQMLPLRGENIVNQGNANAQKAEGMELLQKFTSQKDQLIKDRDSYFTLINEYDIETQSDYIKMFFRVQYPYADTIPSWPKIPLILGICLVAGILFSSFIALLQFNIKHSTNL